MLTAVTSLSIPLLIVHGTQDDIVPSDQALKAHSVNPDHSELVIIPDADHFFSPTEHRDFAAQKIADWFSQLRLKAMHR